MYNYIYLLKSTRNNFLTKDTDIDFRKTCNEAKQYASWNHIDIIFEIDKNCFLKQRQLPKITEKHINPKSIPKMKVKYASQIFSKTLTNFMDVVLKLNKGKTEIIEIKTYLV